MRKLMLVLLALAVGLSPILGVTRVHAATGNIYYVSPAGSDAYPGSQALPWKTIQWAASKAAAGDTVIVAAGTYRENVTFSKSGASGSPITFKGQNTTAVHDASTSSVDNCLDPANACVIGEMTIEGSQVILRNFEIAGPKVDIGEIAGINVKGQYDQVIGNFTHNTWKEGIALRVTSLGSVVLNNTITYAVVSGIWFDGIYQFIYGNTITHTVTRQPDGSTLSTDTDADGIRFFGKFSTVRANIIKDIYVEESPASDYPHSDCFQTWRDATGITFDGNYCELANSTESSPMQKFFMVERSSTSGTIGEFDIINNIFVSKSANQPWTPIQIGSDSCSSALPLADITIANNTFVRPAYGLGDPAILMRCTNTALIENNAFYNFGNQSSPYILQDKNNNVNVTIANNSVFTSTGEIPEGGPYPGDAIGSLWMKDPQFINVTGGDYRLQPSSPLIDRGVDLGTLIDHDYLGVARPQGAGFDIGAYEQMAPIEISGNAGDSGITLTYSNGGTKTAISDASGNYSFSVPHDWSGTVTPSKVYYTFTPKSNTYIHLAADKPAQDYTFSISSFADVTTDYWAWSYIEDLYAAHVTNGCGFDPVTFCPERAVTRAEMAVFILRAKNGTATPIPSQTDIFADVPVPGKEWMQPWIEKFYLEGVTNGCNLNPLRYCPERQVTRAEMAVFILRALYGKGYQPPAVTVSSFSDVPVAGKEWMMPWIEEYYKEGMTTGCKQSPSLQYCPEQSVTRAEMAVFLYRAFAPYAP